MFTVVFAHAPHLPHLSDRQAEQIRAIKSQAVIVDLRSPKEVADTPGPANALFWDFNADNTVPTALLPTDKATPIVFY